MGKLHEEFLVPPFSVLDGRAGYWMEAKRAWISLGIKSEVGRDAPVLHCLIEKTQDGRMEDVKYTSIFDPFLCEICYNWFSCKGALILDPFAGGSVRGIVAALLGRNYVGCDLREEQVHANQDNLSEIRQRLDTPGDACWICQDSAELCLPPEEVDFIFTCPPYGDLERYSEDPRDLSTLDKHAFVAKYRRILLKCFRALKQDRFGCIVVGNYRDKVGNYIDLVGLTVRAAEESGAGFYNECILLSPVASASMRAAKQFRASRKVVKTHQNVLVFLKGDAKKATSFCREVE